MDAERRKPLTLAQLLTLVAEPDATAHLREYFSPGSPLPNYSGGRFELLAGGGDRASAANHIDAADLIAVELLSVQVPALVALDLLDGDLGEQIGRLLPLIPTDAVMADPGAAALLAGPATTAWTVLREPDGMGWVTAGKLLARKRPRLVPVYDRIVRCAYGRPPGAGVWSWLHEHFSADGGVLDRQLARTRDDAGVPVQVSTLRVLDVIVWMRHRDEHRPHRCSGLDV